MIIVFGSEKGGVGKSTTLVNLAVQRTLKDKRVLIIDADVQKTSTNWVLRRDHANLTPQIRYNGQTGAAITKQIQMLADDYDDILIDTRGADSEELRGAMLVADKLISPVQPSQADLETLVDMERIVKMVHSFNPGLKALVLANMASTHAAATTEQDVGGYCEDLTAFTFMKTIVKVRQVFKEAMRLGKAVVEMDGSRADEKAIFEITQLEKEIWDGL